MFASLHQLDKTLEEYLVKKSPALPKDIIKLLVTLSPWFAVLGVIFGLPAVFAILGLGALVGPYAYFAGVRSGSYWLFWIIGLVQVVLAGLAIKPLFAKKVKGWQLLFYSQLLSFLVSLVHFNLGSLIIAVVSFYLLYQIKKSYR